MTIGWNDNTPIYRQLKERVIGMMLDGALKAGDALPSVRQVAAEYQLNPITVSKAYQELVDDNLVEKRRGIGMYVTEGASEKLLASERERFVREEWPAMVERIRRLGLDLEQLLRAAAAGSGDMSAVISAKGLTKRYGKQVAVDHVSFDIPAGRIVGLIGPNGSGKTTTLKAALGLVPFEGELTVLGLDPRTQRDALMQDVCFIADVAILPRWLRVSEAIDFVAGVHPRFDREKAERYLANTKLTPSMKVKSMSKGMVVQLHLALVMAIDAKLLVLDEPTLGLDIIYRKQFYQNLLEDYFDEQKTIIITTHQVEEVEHILTDLMFIRDGKIVLAASMDEVGERYTEVMVPNDKVNAANALQPIDRRTVFGKSVMLFDGVPRTQLSAIGETRNISVADLFVATMKGSYA